MGEIKKDIDLTGGTQVSIITQHEISPSEIKKIFKDAERIRIAKSFGKTTLLLAFQKNVSAEKVIEKLENSGITVESFSVQKISPVLAEKFYSQMLGAMIIAFIFMSIVVFVVFRNLLPSFYVLFAVAADVFEAFAFAQLLGIPLSIPSLAALLLLIGYSADTDILLTSRVLKREQALGEALTSAFKTGLTMAFTTLSVLLVIVFLSTSEVLKSIAIVLLIGILADIINTWCANAVMLRWWVERKKK